jgi:GNAT superfamily N-acetyltransferase
MAYFLFKCWHERLYRVKRADVLFRKSDLALKMVPITEENLSLVCELRDPVYEEQFKYQLSMGDFGYYAYYEDRPVGYGWAKHRGSGDYFFKISEGCVYLCRFFVHESVRGHNVYPALIGELIKKEADTDTFYIAAERGNIASENGLKKVGFTFLKEHGFIRGFKKTFNMKRLR